MTWLAWRQARSQVLVAAGALVVVLITLALTRGHVANTAPKDLTTAYESLRLLGTALIGVPAAIGAFWGAPLLARELELGTLRLAWTQSITRGRWLAVKLLLLGLVAAAFTAAFSMVFTWWSLPFDQDGSRIGTANFGQRGIVPIAYALFALALGTFVGTVVRRTLPAMALTLVGFFVTRFSFQLLVRPHLAETVILNAPSAIGPTETARASGAWIVSTSTLDGAGKALSPGAVDQLLVNTCHLTRDSSDQAWAECAHQVGIHDVVHAHPASQFWTLQVWEALAFGLLAAVLVAATYWWVNHRTV